MKAILAFLTALVASLFFILTYDWVEQLFDYGDFALFLHNHGVFIVYNLIIAICIFFIVKGNFRSFWYVPIIANLGGIIVLSGRLFASERDESGHYIHIIVGWGLSIIITIIAVRVGKRIESGKIKESPKTS